MNLSKLFDRTAPKVGQPRPIEFVKSETVTHRKSQADAMPQAPMELKLENNAARIELPNVEVPDSMENWLDAYAEILEYLDNDKPADRLAAVGLLNQRTTGFAKIWVKSASADALQQILNETAKEACKLDNDCVAMLKSDKRDMNEKVRIKNQLDMHADILKFVEQSDTGQSYKPAYEYLRSAATVAG